MIALPVVVTGEGIVGAMAWLQVMAVLHVERTGGAQTGRDPQDSKHFSKLQKSRLSAWFCCNLGSLLSEHLDYHARIAVVGHNALHEVLRD